MKTMLYAVALATLGGWSARADETAAMNQNTTSPARATDSYAGKLGAGVVIGEPTGGTVKYWFNDTLAIDGAVGWSSHADTDLYLHSDLLWHCFDLIPVPQGRLPVYFGVGGLVRFRDNHHDDQAGIRVPVGLSYMFDHVPVDVFVEIAPAMDVSPEVRGEITGGIGIRFWF